jgi:HPt (histidine-containing phosphotransfer) domain-containing protein
VLDESTLNQLSSLMGSPSLVRLLTIFADELQSVAAELDLISTADLARRCHKLKSSAGQLGFKELSGLCEIAAKEARDTTVRVENRDLRSGLARAIEVARSLAEGGSRQSPIPLAS